MPSNLEILGDAYEMVSSQGRLNSSSIEQTPQKKLFARVTELLNKAGVSVKGNGSFALDVDDNGNIEIIGDIENKKEVATALGNDSDVLKILKNNKSANLDSDSAGTGSKWSQDAYYVELNGKVFVEDLGEYLSSTVNKEITGIYYGQFNTYYDTDEFGFNERTGVDFAFLDSLFESREERDALFNYIDEKISSKVEGIDSAAGMCFSLEQFNTSRNLTANNFFVKVKSGKGEELDRLVENVLNSDRYVKNEMFKSKQQLRNFQTVVDAHYGASEQNKLKIYGRFDSLLGCISGLRHYSTENDNNKDGIAAAKKMWEITKNSSASDIEEYSKNSRILTDNYNEIGKKYGSTGNEESVINEDSHVESKLFSTILNNTEDVAPGTAVASAQVVDIDKSNASTIRLGVSDVKGLLGLNCEGGVDEIVSTLLAKISSLKEESSELVNNILAEQGLSLGEDEKVDIGVAEDGTVTVTSQESGVQAKKRATELQEALNNDPDKAKELASSLQELEVNQTAMTELSTEEGLTKNTAFKLFKIMPDNAAKRELSTVFEGVEGVDGIELDNSIESMTFSDSGFISDNIDTTITHMKRDIQEEVMGAMEEYNEESDVSPAAPPDMYLRSFEAILDDEGNIEVTGGVNGENSELNGRLKRIAEKLLDQDKLSSKFEAISTLLIEQHGYEHNDTDEFEHSVKISVDYPLGLSYEVVSPEADKAAEKELGDTLRDISESVISYIEDENGQELTSPIEIKVDEQGKLSASTSSLTKAEGMQLESVLEILNVSLEMNEGDNEGNEKGNVVVPSRLEEAFENAKGLKNILAKFHVKDNMLNVIK